MKKTTKRTISLLLALCMILALPGCGKKKTGTDTSAPNKSSSTPSTGSSTQTPQTPVVQEPEPEPVIPDMNSLLSAEEVDELVETYEQDGSNDYTHWYPDGDKYAEFYLMFEDDSYVTVVDGNGEEAYRTKLEGNHIVNTLEDDPEMDFVFIDNLTCYETVTGQWYMSAIYEEAYASLTSTTFYQDGDDTWNITFNPDGTYYWPYGNKVEEGIWWFASGQQIAYVPSDKDFEARIAIFYAPDSWEIEALACGTFGADMYYPAA